MSEYRSTGWAAHRDHYAVPVLFNPYTGQPRDVRDVQSDPQGILIVPPGKVEMRASKPTVKESLRVATPPAAPVQEPKFVRMVDGVPCITLAEHKHLMAATPPAAQPAPVQEPVAWMVDVDIANYQGQSEYRTILAWNAKPVWSGTHEVNEVLKAVPLYTTPPYVATPLAAQPAPVQEPVAITEQMAFAFHNAISDGAIGTDDLMDIMHGLEAAFAHITTPPAARPAIKPLTDEQIEMIWTVDQTSADDCASLYYAKVIARAIEAAHGIKENT